ncbi:MAG TPA: PAS domain-containing protein, partial [Myxococcaceae bacterium]|nr:PAS domain-containing protein [Myxococcaceae bacterium]
MSAVKTVKQVTAPEVDGDALLGALATLEQGSLDGCVVLRAERNAAGVIEDFSFLFANPSAERTLGRQSEQLIGQRLVDVLPMIHRGGRIPQCAQVVETGQPLVWEGPYRDGWFRIQMTRFQEGVLARFQDITTS